MGSWGKLSRKIRRRLARKEMASDTRKNGIAPALRLSF